LWKIERRVHMTLESYSLRLAGFLLIAMSAIGAGLSVFAGHTSQSHLGILLPLAILGVISSTAGSGLRSLERQMLGQTSQPEHLLRENAPSEGLVAIWIVALFLLVGIAAVFLRGASA
jgi:hypothetical protein